MGLGRVTEAFLKKHIEDIGREYKSFAILTEDKRFKEAVVEAIYHAELMSCIYIRTFIAVGDPIQEFCINNVPSVESTLCDLVKMSTDFDAVIENTVGIEAFMKYVRKELGWSHEE